MGPDSSFGSEPAPMGIADLGFTDSLSSYSYSTPRFLASAHLRAASVSGPSFDQYSVTFQLNVVLVLTNGAQSVSYWIQDVPFLNTSTQGVTFVDNIWNLSNSDLSMPANSVAGNGSVYPYGGASYYGDVAATTLPGSFAVLSYPANFSAQVVESGGAGSVRVAFEYEDGYGWVTYDNVSFPWAHGWSSSGFLVDGARNPPAGAYYDAEWVLGGPGGGSSTADVRSDFDLSLEEFNGHNFQAVPNAFDFGADTAESISNVVVTRTNGTSSGLPGATVDAGPGDLTFLFGPHELAIVNASGIPAQGTLVVNGISLPYRGGQVNVSFVPGSYVIDLESGSTTDWVNETFGPGEYFATRGTIYPVTLSPSSALPEALVNVSGDSSALGQTLDVQWLPGGATMCGARVGATGTYSCSFDTPLIRSRWYGVLASNQSTSSFTGIGSFFVRTNLSVSLSAPASFTEAHLALNFTARARGGWGAYSGYAWNFGDGTDITGGAGFESHAFATPGSYTVRVGVNDSLGNTATDAVVVTVDPDPSLPPPVANRSSADLGQSVTFTVNPRNTSAGGQIGWLGLPETCLIVPPSAVCVYLNRSGIFSVRATLTDSLGYTAESPALSFQVFVLPTVGPPTANRSTADVGQPVSFTAPVLNPGAGSDRFQWDWGAPPEEGFHCTPTAAASLHCIAAQPGAQAVNVTILDGNGGSSRQGSQSVEVVSALTVASPVFSPPIADVGLPIDGSVAVIGGVGAYRYVWSDLPGCASSNATVVCVPTVAGQFNVSVAVQDQDGFTASSSATVLVVAPALSLSIVQLPGGETAGETFSFAALVAGGTAPYSYAWVFDNGQEAFSATASHAFDQPGSYPVILKVRDLVGGSMSTEVSVQVQPAPVPSAIPSLGPLIPLIGALVIVAAGAVLVAALRPGWPPRRPPTAPLRRPAAPPPRRVWRPPPKPQGWDDPSGWE